MFLTLRHVCLTFKSNTQTHLKWMVSLSLLVCQDILIFCLVFLFDEVFYALKLRMMVLIQFPMVLVKVYFACLGKVFFVWRWWSCGRTDRNRIIHETILNMLSLHKSVTSKLKSSRGLSSSASILCGSQRDDLVADVSIDHSSELLTVVVHSTCSGKFLLVLM